MKIMIELDETDWHDVLAAAGLVDGFNIECVSDLAQDEIWRSLPPPRPSDTLTDPQGLRDAVILSVLNAYKLNPKDPSGYSDKPKPREKKDDQ